MDHSLATGDGLGYALPGGKIAANPLHIRVWTRGSSEHAYAVGGLEPGDDIPAKVSCSAGHENGIHRLSFA